MYRYHAALALLVGAALLALGIDRFTIGANQALVLREDHATLALIAGVFMVLGSLHTGRQPGMAATLELFAGALILIAATPSHSYLYAYAAVGLLLGIAALMLALAPPTQRRRRSPDRHTARVVERSRTRRQRRQSRQ